MDTEALIRSYERFWGLEVIGVVRGSGGESMDKKGPQMSGGLELLRLSYGVPQVMWNQ